MLSPGAVLSDRYRLTERIAAGGMGEVWRGVDLLLHRPIAVKVLLPSLMADAEFITRFRTEARLMAQLRHPGIVQVYDYGENASIGGRRLDYLVMEFVDGTPLSKRIQQAGRLGLAESMTIVAQVADALQVAHEAGIVHRDVKPANLLVRPGGAVVLVDFGVARSTAVTGITSTNVVMGSAHYMAPEQAEGKPVSGATDVYALGAVAFCCLTGRPPYVGDNPLAILAQLVHGKPPVLPPDVPAPVASVVLRALAKEAGQRFPSAAAFAAAARAALNPGAGSGAFPGAPSSPTAPRQASGTAAFGSGGRSTGFGPAGGAAAAGFGAAGSTGGFAPRPAAGAGSVRPGSAQAFAPGSASAYSPPTGGNPAYGRGSGGSPAYGTASASPAGGYGSAASPAGGYRPAGSSSGGYGSGGSSGGYGAAGPAGGGRDGSPGSSGAHPGAAVAGRKRKNTAVVVAVSAVVLGLAGITAAVAFNPDSGSAPTPGGGATTEGGLPGAGPVKTSRKPRPTGRTTEPGAGVTTAPAGAVTAPSTDPSTTDTEAVTNPRDICGDGYKVIDSAALKNPAGSAKGKVYLLFNTDTGDNCVVTVKTTSLGKKTPTGAFLEVQDGDRTTAADDETHYAGPVHGVSKGACVKWGGAVGAATYESPFEHCG